MKHASWLSLSIARVFPMSWLLLLLFSPALPLWNRLRTLSQNILKSGSVCTPVSYTGMCGSFLFSCQKLGSVLCFQMGRPDKSKKRACKVGGGGCPSHGFSSSCSPILFCLVSPRHPNFQSQLSETWHGRTWGPFSWSQGLPQEEEMTETGTSTSWAHLNIFGFHPKS